MGVITKLSDSCHTSLISSKILVNENIELVVKEGVDFHLSIEASVDLIKHDGRQFLVLG